jgi:hypothetical protein
MSFFIYKNMSNVKKSLQNVLFKITKCKIYSNTMTIYKFIYFFKILYILVSSILIKTQNFLSIEAFSFYNYEYDPITLSIIIFFSKL